MNAAGDFLRRLLERAKQAPLFAGWEDMSDCPLCSRPFSRRPSWVKPGLPPWGPHVRFRRVQTLVREGSPLVKLRNSA